MQISPRKDRKAIILRFTVEGVRFSFHPLPGGKWENKRDRQLVQAIATKIENDVLAGNFDPTLQRYRHKATAETVSCQKPAIRLRLNWLAIWDGYVENLNLKSQTKADHYEMIRRQIIKAKNPLLKETDWLINSKLATSTFNRRLSALRLAIQWAIAQKLIVDDPLKKIKNRQSTLEEEEKSEAKKAPFNSEEITKIINYFQEKHPTYSPFVEFLLFSGVRTGEAVGLRWKDVDLEKKIVTIAQSISRERGGYKKIRKRPKTLQSLRSLKMSERIYQLFIRINPEKNTPDELIFKSPHGCIIDHGNFRANYWKPALEKLEISYRKPYATRHTLLSEALESGMTIPQVAAIAGHKDGRMILQHYGRQINQPQLPD